MKFFLRSVLAIIVGWVVSVLLIWFTMHMFKPADCVTPHDTDVDYIHQRQHFTI